MLSTELILLLTILTWSFSEVTAINKEVLINATTNIICTPNENIQIQWHHTAPGRSSNHLYAGGKFYNSPSRGFRLEKDSNTGPYHLVIPHTTAGDAGLYECKEDAAGSRVFGSTQLVVLESSPVCNSNMKPEGYVGPNACKLAQEDMTFTCAVSFNGKPPQMIWKTLNGSQSFSDSTCKTENGRINCSLTVKADSKYDGSIFSCRIGNLSVNCNKEVIKIHYFERLKSSEVMTKNVSDKVNCSVKTNQKLQYKWTLLQGNEYVTVIENQELLIKSPGFHKCVAEYSFRDFACVADGSEVIALTPSPNTIDCETGHAGTAAISVLSIIIAIGFGVIAVLVYHFRKEMCNRCGKNKKVPKTGEGVQLTGPTNENNGGPGTNGTTVNQAVAVGSSCPNT